METNENETKRGKKVGFPVTAMKVLGHRSNRKASGGTFYPITVTFNVVEHHVPSLAHHVPRETTKMQENFTSRKF